MSQVMLTTSDNPYNPFTHWNEWYAYDEFNHYCTSGLIARFQSSSYDDSEADQEADRLQAIDRVLELFPFGVPGFEDKNGKPIYYKKIQEDEKQNEIENKQEEN